MTDINRKRPPTLYYDTMRGLVSVRRDSITYYRASGNVHAVVARSAGAYPAGLRISFRPTSLVYVVRRTRYATFVRCAFDAESGKVIV